MNDRLTGSRTAQSGGEWTRRRFLSVAGAASVAALIPAQGSVAATSGRGSGHRRGLVPGGLRVEYLDEPLGIDVRDPRLSWVPVASNNGHGSRAQQAYRILVGSRPELVEAERADLWDSGIVASDRLGQVQYGGRALEPGRRHYWSVRVWDENDRPSEWSDVAWWETGLLAPEDWAGARWIRGAGTTSLLSGSSWIWYPDTGSGINVPGGTRFFRHVFDLPAGAAATWARALVTADDGFVLHLNGVAVGDSGGTNSTWRQARTINLLPHLRPGRNVLAVAATNNVYGAAGLLGRFDITTGSGEPISFVTDTAWLSAVDAPSDWQQPDFDDSGWPAVRVIGPYGMDPWGTSVQQPVDPANSNPLLRTEFQVDKRVRRARLYGAALGLYEFRLNGRKVGDHVLEPAWTEADARVLSVAYDVTKLLRRGPNALGVLLGHGWAENGARERSTDDLAMMATLVIEYADGSTASVGTDTAWQTATGPLLSDSPFRGESYDARRDRAGWDEPDFDTTDWLQARDAKPVTASVVASPYEPIRVNESVRPARVTELGPGVWVVDFGRTISGWARISVEAPAGTTIGLQYAESLNADGSVAVRVADSLARTGRFQYDEYIAKGRGEETWEARFTYKGFRYVQVTGMPSAPGARNIQAQVVHNDVSSVGRFSSSENLYDRIHDAMRRTILNNLHGAPTDTPVYEKLGYLGDAQVGMTSMTNNFDMAAFYTKWLADIRDAQASNGQLPVITPSFAKEPPAEPSLNGDFRYASEWTAAYPLITWHMYQTYGDERVVAEHYPTIKRYVDWELSTRKDGLVDSSLGDYLSPGYTRAPEDRRLSGTAYVFREAQLLSRMADLLARADDATTYQAEADALRVAFNFAFLDQAAGHYRTAKDPGYRQTSNLLAVAFGLVPAEFERRVVDSIAADVRARGNHLNTGCLGTGLLLPVLSRFGYHDLAHQVARQKTHPGWGAWFEAGGDTIWEGWTNTPRSRGHYFLGTIDDWFYGSVAGIQNTGIAYSTLTIRPYVTGPLTHASARIDTVRGRVSSSWRIKHKTLTLEVEVPIGSVAEVFVPGDNPRRINIDSARSARVARIEDGHVIFEIGPGEWTFRTAAP
jgi:alpha-L-rhamnosidase